MTERETEPTSGRLTTSPTPGEGYLAALWLIGPLMPGLAAVVTVLVYLLLPANATGAAPADPALAVVAGLGTTVVAWLLLGFAARPMTAAAKVQPRFYNELKERYQQLHDRLRALSAESDPAAVEARTQIRVADELLTGAGGGPALRWALAHGYVSVLRALHRAEEALLMVEPQDGLVGEALHDELSLEGSTIGDRERLQGILRAATYKLSAGAGPAFLPPEHGTTQRPVDALTLPEAREALREVRHAINSFRDDARDGLVRARNRLVWTMLAVAVATYLLLGLVLILDAATIYVGTAAAFYLVGAIIGLFDRLRVEASRTSAVEDFGLYQARLVATPLISGLAALAGVYLVSVAPSLLPSVGTTAGQQLGQATPLTTVFDLSQNQIGLVYAAIFGLAPETLTGGLRQQADRLERDLLTSQPATTTAGSGAPAG